jgi:2-dehydropantoate 2-reductase
MSSISPMRILIIGAGAVGGYYGARLAAAGRDVTFLVREARAAQLRAIGLQVISPHGDLSLTPKLLLASEIKEPFDLILLSTKAYSLDAAIKDFAPAVGPKTMILPLLNGMKHLDKLVARFGEDPVLGGSTTIVADVDNEGRIHQMELLHNFNFGERDKSITPRIQAVAATLANAGFDDKLCPDILAVMWQKWTMLSAMGAITCLLRGSIGAVAAAPGGTETALRIIAETAAIAAANGYPPPPPYLDMVNTRLTKPGSPLTASMYRDLHKGARVEADHILGDLLARGQAHGVVTPLLQAACVQLSIYSSSLSAT